MNTFLQVADYYLVAQARAGGHTVVTHEVPSASTRKIKIPDACIGLGIKCMTPYEMLRSERARFVLGVSSMSKQTNEHAFEVHVEEVLLQQGGWQPGTNAEWDVERALFPARVVRVPRSHAAEALGGDARVCTRPGSRS